MFGLQGQFDFEVDGFLRNFANILSNVQHHSSDIIFLSLYSCKGGYEAKLSQQTRLIPTLQLCTSKTCPTNQTNTCFLLCIM